MPADAERDLVAGIIQLANLLTRSLAPVFEKARVTPQQWAILAALEHAGQPMSLAALARMMLVSKQNMTGMIVRIEQLGLVERGDDPEDLRSSRLALTRRGRSVIEKLRPAYEQWRTTLAGDLNERDLATTARTIETLIENLTSD
jgi:DNA-binding MarR family transcriptional regulator